MRWDTEFSTCGILFAISFRFWNILDFQSRDVQSVIWVGEEYEVCVWQRVYTIIEHEYHNRIVKKETETGLVYS